MKIIYFATPLIALSTLEFLYNQPDTEIIGVVTQPDRPAGRGHKVIASVIKLFAEEHNIEIFQPEKIKADKDVISKLIALSPDFFVTFAFGQMLSQEILDIPKFGTINLHGSLLPKYRGANPIFQAILNGEKETGITTMKTDIGMDSGDICLTKKIEIPENMNAIELVKKFEEFSPQIMYDTLKKLYKNELSPIPQNHNEATYAPKFVKEDGIINWKNSANNIHNQIRAMIIFPTAVTFFKNKKIQILSSKVIEKESINEEVGKISKISKEGLYIETGKGTILIETVKPEGKKEMNSYEWSNGVNLKVGDLLGGNIE